MKTLKNCVLAAAALAAAYLVAPPAAHAAVVHYQFTPDSQQTFISNQNNAVFTETFTGSFSYDVTTNTVAAVNITISGGVNATFKYPFTFGSNGSTYFGVSAAGVNNNNGILAFLEFQHPLDGGVSPNLFVIGGSAIYNTADGNLFAPENDTLGGSVTASAPGPVPGAGLAGMAILLLAFCAAKARYIGGCEA